MLHKKKKSTNYRGSKTHGCGSMKKRRGKGNKGGAGNAGSGKRADQKRPSFWKSPTGRHGFTSKKIRDSSINIKTLENRIKTGSLKDENGVYDLNKLGYDKLLGKGAITLKLKIKVSKASKNVIETIKKAGGEVISNPEG